MSLAARNASLFVGRRPSRRLAWIITAVLLLLGSGTAAYAFWAATTSSNNAAAAADALTPGSKPAVTANGAALSVTWANGTTVNGRPATGYTVARYSAATGGTAIPATGGCAGTVTTLTCTEQNVPGGTWYYTVTPAIALWTGGESPRSNGISSDATPPTASATLSPSPNAAGWNNTSPVTVTITADDGTSGSGVASITYAVDGGAKQTVNGAVATIPVAGDGTHTVSYFATDKVGNAGSAQNQAVKIDTQAPVAPAFTTPLPNANAATVSGVTVGGTAEAGATINLTASDGAGHSVPGTATASGSGAWSITVNLSSLNQGTVTYTATATDAAGNVGSARTATGVKDTAAPAAATGLSVPPYVFSGNLNNVLVKGSAEAGSTVKVIAKDSAGTAVQGTATTIDGPWSLTLNLGFTSGMVDGSVTYTVTVTDGAGNTSGPATTSDIRDTNVSLTLNKPQNILAGNVNNYVFSGTTDSGSPVNVSVTDGITTVPGTAAGTSWGTGPLNLSAIKDSSTNPVVTVTATATTTDAAGNSITVSVPVTKDTLRPTVRSVTLANGSGGSKLNQADKGDTVTIQFFEALDPAKFCSGTSSATTFNGTVTLIDNSTNDGLSFATGDCNDFNIGTIALKANYVSANATFGPNGNGSGGASTLTLDPTGKILTIKFGNSATGSTLQNVAITKPSYTPSANLTDLAGNGFALPITAFDETNQSGF
ncbi:beta strand repeat-containing protein [Pseudarthrobacter sp. NPDC058119]|uniref:beta strand repeat-containing protein n=1 Tax=Pseudarthrobacter sp. NPDC058119 TaxID=3346348 RepID=UPI0036D9DF28